MLRIGCGGILVGDIIVRAGTPGYRGLCTQQTWVLG